MNFYYNPELFNYTLESVEKDNYIIATYFISNSTHDQLKQVGFMALESSTGGWMDFPGETKNVRKELSAKVLGYYPMSPHLLSKEDEFYKPAIIQLGFPITGSAGSTKSISMLLTSIAGNILEMPGNPKLLDVYLPKSFVQNFKGPKFGVEGVQKLLGKSKAPLTNMMIKPKIGLTPEAIEDMTYKAGLGGVDHIKDDELASNTFNCSFEKRIKAVMSGLKKAEQETGNKAIYTVNITDAQTNIFDNAKKAISLGANGIMLNNAQGFETLRLLADSKDINVPILYHPAGMSANKSISRIVSAKLARLCGADFYLTGSPFAKWADQKQIETTVRSAQMLSSPFYHIQSTYIVQSATANKVPLILSDYGTNTVLGGGGAIHGHPEGIVSGIKAIKQSIELTMKGNSLEEFKHEYKALNRALDINPVVTREGIKRY